MVNRTYLYIGEVDKITEVKLTAGVVSLSGEFLNM